MAGGDGLTFGDEDALDGAGLGGADFVLHLHGFDDEQALTGFDFVASGDENANDFAGHGRGDLLSAFGFKDAAALAAPDARVLNDHGEFFAVGLDVEPATRFGLDANFEGLAVEKNRVGAGGDLDGVGGKLAAVEAEKKTRAVAGDLDIAFAAGNLDLEFHRNFLGLVMSRAARKLSARVTALPRPQ